MLSPNLSKDFGYLHEQFTIHTQSLCSSDFMVTKISMYWNLQPIGNVSGTVMSPVVGLGVVESE
jgi:hypothetical protein